MSGRGPFYPDASVIISAVNGVERLSATALSVFANPEYRFIGSKAQAVEAIGGAARRGAHRHAAMARALIEGFDGWVHMDDQVMEVALELMSSPSGPKALDAIHSALCLRSGAVLLTFDRRLSRLSGVKGLEVELLQVESVK